MSCEVLDVDEAIGVGDRGLGAVGAEVVGYCFGGGGGGEGVGDGEVEGEIFYITGIVFELEL